MIYAINGVPADINMDLEAYSGMDLPKNSEILISTNKGDLLRSTDADGEIGITFSILKKEYLFGIYGNPVLQFLFTVIGLSLAINFVVGVVNILPVPIFDGGRLISTNVKNDLLVKILSYGTLACFLLNFLPLLFH